MFPVVIRATALLLLIAAAASLLALIITYGVNGPFWDHLTSAEIFDRWHNGELSLEFLFRAHNEHRKAVPRLVVLALGMVTRFNNPAEMVLQWTLLCTSVGVVFRAFLRDTRLDRAAVLPVFLPVGLLMLSLRPYDVILVGDGLLTYLSMIFIVSALYVLAFGRRTWASFAGAAACGVLASFSQSNGLLVWPIGAVLLACDLRVRVPLQSSRPRTWLWMVIGAATMVAYFYGYSDPGNHPPASFVLRHPQVALHYFLTVTGGSLSAELNGAVAAGLAIVAFETVVGGAVLWAWWRNRQRPPFGAWLVVLAVASHVMITLNRAGFGVEQALAPRYAAYSCFGPIGVYWCGVAFRDHFRLARPLATSMATLVIVGYLAGSLHTLSIRRDWYADKHWRSHLLYTAKYQPRSVLEAIYPNPDHGLVYANILEKLGLNVFAEPRLQAQDLVPATHAAPFAIDTINGKQPTAGQTIEVGAQDAVLVTGWAMDPAGSVAASAIFATIDGATDIPGRVGMPRQPIERVPKPLRWTGFGVSFGGFVVPPGEHELALKIVSADQRHFYLTAPIARIVRK